MDIYSIANEIGFEDDYSYLHDLLKKAIDELKVEGIFTIIFIDDVKMQKMNKEFRGIDRTTDVLSFALNDEKTFFDESINVLGDIYISIPKMKEQAKEYGHSEKRELSFLVIHGLLHLLGYDHINEKDEKEMFLLQKEVLKNAGIEK